MRLNKITLEIMTADKEVVVKMTDNEMSKGKMTLEEMTGRNDFRQMTVDELALDRMSMN
jgi:hypothetical protein